MDYWRTYPKLTDVHLCIKVLSFLKTFKSFSNQSCIYMMLAHFEAAIYQMVTSFSFIFSFCLASPVSVSSGSFHTAIGQAKIWLLVWDTSFTFAVSFSQLLSLVCPVNISERIVDDHCLHFLLYFMHLASTPYTLRQKSYQWTYNYQIHGSLLSPHLFNFSFTSSVDYHPQGL